MNLPGGFFYTVLFAAVVENLVFARALGVDGILRQPLGYRNIARFGAAVTLVALLGCTLAWLACDLFGEEPFWPGVRWLVAFLCVTAAYLLVYALFGRAGLNPPGGGNCFLSSAAFNGAALGTVLLSLSNRAALPATVAYCLGCSLGLTAAMMLIHSGRERLELSRVPRSFTGLPVTLIYIGILSLAIYGLIGHQLPT
jgi:electron transport complex protein RnfA